MNFACWWNQHPEYAEAAAPLSMEPGTRYYADLFAEAQRVQRNGLVQETCTSVLDVVSAPEAESTQVAAVMTTKLVPTVEIGRDGTRTPLPDHWDRLRTLVRWRQQPDGRWLIFESQVVEQP